MTFIQFWKNFCGHLHTVNAHRRLVRKEMFKLGMYYQGLTHDLSKYSPVEFIPGVIYFQGNRSPNNAQREKEGVSSAWLHHKGRNRHHYEYWIDYSTKKTGDINLEGMPMPKKYVIEMFCDRIAASKIYNKDKYTDSDALNYYLQGRGHYLMHPDTEALLYRLLKMLSEKGEDYTYAYIRRKILHRKKQEEIWVIANLDF